MIIENAAAQKRGIRTKPKNQVWIKMEWKRNVIRYYLWEWKKTTEIYRAQVYELIDHPTKIIRLMPRKSQHPRLKMMKWITFLGCLEQRELKEKEDINFLNRIIRNGGFIEYIRKLEAKEQESSEKSENSQV